MARTYRKKGFVIGCEDEATFGLLPIIQRGWARRGSKPIVRINSKHKCTNVFAARSRYSFVFAFSKRKKQRDFIRFSEKVLKRWGKVLLFVDKGPCHNGKKVDAFLKIHKHTFKLVFFPSYSPELNPQEQCWKPGRKRISNRFIPSLAAMKYQLSVEFNKPSFMPKMFDYLSN